MASSEQCAVGSDGHLLPATEIQWFNDPDDKAPIAAPSKDQPQLEGAKNPETCFIHLHPLGRGHRKKSNKFAQMLLAEQHDENGKFITVKPRRSRTAAASKKSVLSKNTFEVLDVEDSGDESFEASASGSSTESESDSNNVSMKEVNFPSLSCVTRARADLPRRFPRCFPPKQSLSTPARLPNLIFAPRNPIRPRVNAARDRNRPPGTLSMLHLPQNNLALSLLSSAGRTAI
jgi:hypothetical protein